MNIPQLVWGEEPAGELAETDDPRRDIRIGGVIAIFFFVMPGAAAGRGADWRLVVAELFPRSAGPAGGGHGESRR